MFRKSSAPLSARAAPQIVEARPPRRGQGWQDALTWVQFTFKARRVRDQLFDADLFAEPAWDILLELYGAHLEGRAVTVADAYVASSVPPVTARRWTDTLVLRGLLEVGGNEGDGTDRPIWLSESAKASMQTMFLKLRAMADSHPDPDNTDD